MVEMRRDAPEMTDFSPVLTSGTRKRKTIVTESTGDTEVTVSSKSRRKRTVKPKKSEPEHVLKREADGRYRIVGVAEERAASRRQK